MSAHIQAESGAIADRVLLPGDPLRAKYIAERYLRDAVCYNTVRGMLGYTGYYGGKRVSVQGTGMGMPSLSIYVYELIHNYQAKTLIRIGSCGSLQDMVAVRDVILAATASTDSGMAENRFGAIHFSPAPDSELYHAAREEALRRGIRHHVGTVFTSDRFYSDTEDGWRLMSKYGVLGIEMETYELYVLAMRERVRAMSILTVSDHMLTGEGTSAFEREQSFNEMIEIALEIC